MAKAGHNIWYNDSDGTNRGADRVGVALSGVKDNGRVNVQVVGGGIVECEFISDLASYDAEHGDNRGLCCWSVH